MAKVNIQIEDMADGQLGVKIQSEPQPVGDSELSHAQQAGLWLLTCLKMKTQPELYPDGDSNPDFHGPE